MNIIDIIIIILLAFGALLGFKRGFTKALVKGLGTFIVVILAFLLKNPLSVILYENLPFFKFGGLLKGIEVINILLYEVIAFIIVLAILGIALKVLSLATSIFEKLLNATIILGIPSKIAGAIVGVVEYYIIIFVALYVLSLPFINFNLIQDSKMKDKILNNTPILSNVVDKSMGVITEFIELKDKYSDETISSYDFNCDAVRLFLKHNVIKYDSLQKLIDKGKIEGKPCYIPLQTNEEA